jgi:hypothetical protein
MSVQGRPTYSMHCANSSCHPDDIVKETISYDGGPTATGSVCKGVDEIEFASIADILDTLENGHNSVIISVIITKAINLG